MLANSTVFTHSLSFRSKEARATSRSERSEPGSELLFTPKRERVVLCSKPCEHVSKKTTRRRTCGHEMYGLLRDEDQTQTTARVDASRALRKRLANLRKSRRRKKRQQQSSFVTVALKDTVPFLPFDVPLTRKTSRRYATLRCCRTKCILMLRIAERL